MERCAAVQIRTPEDHKGRWAEEFSQYREIRLELGCGKGRFTADTAAQSPDIFLAAIEKVPDAMVVDPAGIQRLEDFLAAVHFAHFFFLKFGCFL